MDACFETLRGLFPECNKVQLAGAVARVNLSLTPAQMKFLKAQRAKTVSLDKRLEANNTQELPTKDPCPEKTTAFRQDQEKLQHAADGWHFPNRQLS